MSQLRWPRRQRASLMHQGEAVRHPPVLYKLSILESADVDDIDGNALAGPRIGASASHPNPHFVFVLDEILDRER